MILLDHGANSNAKTDNNVSPLHLCCLVQRPTTLNVGQESETAVERNRKQNALIQSKLRIIEDLLSRGADPMARDNSGVCPLHLAANGGVPEIFRALLIHTTVMQPARGDRPLMFSVPYVKVCDRFGKNPAHWAIEGKQQETYFLLFLAEFGYAFEGLYDQLVENGVVDVATIQRRFNLTTQELKLLEQFVMKYCTHGDDKKRGLEDDKNISDARRTATPFSDGIAEVQEMMRKHAGQSEDDALLIDTNRMDNIRKMFVQLKSLLVRH